jgi:prolyl-tRNA synthetase
MFVSAKALEREKDHVEGFAPEVAWVTKAGSSDLSEPIAIRPTSETVMYPLYSQWIRSHRDLPLRLNQWCNVVRWEFKHPQPFLRTREFLWQEGHTAFATKEEADVEVLQILDLYRQVYEDVLAVPVIKGIKSEKEKFAGGLYTTTVEAFVPATGRGIQGATSHCLGQNFAKMFDITIDGAVNREFVWQNSWGLTTRTIGVMVMVHGDDKGLVLPPRVASIQVVIVPVGITAKTSDEERKRIEDASQQTAQTLLDSGLRAKADLREIYTPGYKFNHWELRGVPIRLEIGPKDMAKSEVSCIVRMDGTRQQLSEEGLAQNLKDLLEKIQRDMFVSAKKLHDERLVYLTSFDGFGKALDDRNRVLAPWCERTVCEDDVKERSGRFVLM